MKISGIKLLTNFEGQDLVADLLRSVTMRTVVFGRAELRAPWGLHVDLPGRAVFHIVLRGRCWLTFDGAPPVLLRHGDTVLFPHAGAHDMNDDPATAIRPLQELLIQHPMTPDRRFCYGGRGPTTAMLCGAFHLDDPKFNLLGVLLPPLLHIKGDAETSAQLRAILACIEAELKTSQPGGETIVTRVAEAFLVRAIRDYVMSSADQEHGLPAVLRDPSLARILALIHQHPQQHWTVAGLADAANLSRSGFAERFKMQVGATPLRYLQRYRFSRAVELLQTTDTKICDVARSVGYDSESSFSKAFKRLMGKTPGACRGSRRPKLRL